MATKKLTKEDILESISNMSVMDLVDLIKDIEEKICAACMQLVYI